jgi:hypothetical protein
MPQKVSVDEFLSQRKDFVKSGDVLMKVSKGVSSWNPDRRSARFIMSAEVEDRYKDIVIQAGIDLTEFEKNPAAPFAHNSRSFPVGNWSNLAKVLSGRPKRLEGDLTLIEEGADPDADRLAKHIAAGTMRACSIGFIPTEIERREVPEDKRDSYYYPGYLIHTCELLECSPCLIGANPAAIAKAIEEGADGDDLRLYRDMIEEALDNWARHPETGLLIPREEMEKAYRLTVEKITDDIIDNAGKIESEAPEIKVADEIADLPEEVVKSLIERGMVFLVELKSGDTVLAGNLIAKSMEEAEEIVKSRGLGETVIGVMETNSVSDEVADHENLTVTLNVDSNLDETKKQVEELESTVDRVLGKLAKIFGISGKDTPAPVKKEPVVDIVPEVKEPPTAEEIEAAKARAAAVRERLVSKGMIAAE